MNGVVRDNGEDNLKGQQLKWGKGPGLGGRFYFYLFIFL